MNAEDRAFVLEEALERLDEAAELIEGADLPEWDRRRVFAELQGSEGGWLGDGLVADLLRADSSRRSATRWLSELERGAARFRRAARRRAD